MKKLILIAAAALCSFSLSAQISVGGSIGFSSSSTKDKVLNTTSSSSTFNIAPSAEYILKDDLSVGARVGISFGGSSPFGLTLNPYGRYNLLTVSKFAVAGEAGVSFGLSSTKTPFIAGGGFTKSSRTDLSIYVKPVLLYALTDKVTLEAALHICQLSLDLISSKNTSHPDGAAVTTTSDTSSTRFNLGVDSNDIFGAGLGMVSIGFKYAL